MCVLALSWGSPMISLTCWGSCVYVPLGLLPRAAGAVVSLVLPGFPCRKCVGVEAVVQVAAVDRVHRPTGTGPDASISTWSVWCMPTTPCCVCPAAAAERVRPRGPPCHLWCCGSHTEHTPHTPCTHLCWSRRPQGVAVREWACWAQALTNPSVQGVQPVGALRGWWVRV